MGTDPSFAQMRFPEISGSLMGKKVPVSLSAGGKTCCGAFKPLLEMSYKASLKEVEVHTKYSSHRRWRITSKLFILSGFFSLSCFSETLVLKCRKLGKSLTLTECSWPGTNYLMFANGNYRDSALKAKGKGRPC